MHREMTMRGAVHWGNWRHRHHGVMRPVHHVLLRRGNGGCCCRNLDDLRASTTIWHHLVADVGLGREHVVLLVRRVVLRMGHHRIRHWARGHHVRRHGRVEPWHLGLRRGALWGCKLSWLLLRRRSLVIGAWSQALACQVTGATAVPAFQPAIAADRRAVSKQVTVLATCVAGACIARSIRLDIGIASCIR